MDKTLIDVLPKPPMHWVGDGFPVRSLFSYQDPPALFSPFLLLDYAAPRDFAPSAARRGVGEHPHRGFETVTIAFQGEVEHRDSGGNAGRIGPGDVQWMTAASGVVHEEMHGREFTRKGGTLEMVQLWVNLPRKHKMSAPGYQDLASTRIPVVERPEGSARIIAGSFEGARGPARTFTPIEVWDVAVGAGKTFRAELPADHGGAILVRRGAVRIGDAPVAEGDAGILDRRGRVLSIEASKDAQIVLMAGAPIDEPVTGYGPFVMNSPDEIRRAVEDYREGKMGRLDAWTGPTGPEPTPSRPPGRARRRD
jgi:hypothetical protein